MTQTTARPSTTTTPSRLRTLYLVRALVSLVWVALVFSTAGALAPASKPGVAVAVLAIVYPLWDVAATAIESRLVGGGPTNRLRLVNIVVGSAATVAMVVAVLSSVGAAILVFGIWAFLSGAIQLVVAIRRWRAIGAQWPMVISGGLSVFAGLAFAAMSMTSNAGLAGVAGYSAFGAFWFVVAAVMLTLRARRGASSLT